MDGNHCRDCGEDHETAAEVLACCQRIAETHPSDCRCNNCKAAEFVARLVPDRGGWFNMACWNGLSAAQQHRLVAVGNLPFGYDPEGDCTRSAEVAVECQGDATPGPRFYCRQCAVEYLLGASVDVDSDLFLDEVDRFHQGG